MSAVASGRCAIETRYMPPTNSRGTRVAVSKADGTCRRYYGWNDEHSVEECHRLALSEYLADMQRDGEWIIGAAARGYYAVRVPESKA